MNTVNALLFLCQSRSKNVLMHHSVIIHLPCKHVQYALTTCPVFLYEADPQYVWPVVDVYARDAFCLQETLFGLRSYRIENTSCSHLESK